MDVPSSDGGLFVGRTRELDVLLDALRATRSGGARCVLVTGAAGVGKTTLVVEALRRLPAGASPPVVLTGGCVHLPGLDYPHLPFGPLVEALRWLRGSGAPPEVVRAALAWIQPTPLRGDVVGSGEDAVHRRFAELVELIQATAEWRPLVLVLEDLQWADPSSLAGLVYLVRALTTEPVLVLITVRDGGSGGAPVATAVAELERCAGTRSVSVRALPDDDVAALVRAIRGPGVEDRAVRDVVARAGGNALAATELAQHGTTDWLPRTYGLAVEARLGSLTSAAVDVLRVAAAVGRPVRPELLRAILKPVARGHGEAAPSTPGAPASAVTAAPTPTGGDVLDAIDEAVGSGLLVSTPTGLAFRHGLDRDVVDSQVPPRERRRLHALVAAALERRASPGDADRLAEVAGHWSRSGQDVAAYRTCLVAARAAVGVRAFPEAVSMFDRALEHHVGIAEDVATGMVPAWQVRLELAEALRLSGDLDRAITTLETELAGPLPADDAALCWERLAWFRRESGDGAGAYDAYVRALDAVGDRPSSPRVARVLAGYAAALMIFGDLEEGGRRAQEALQAATVGGNEVARASAMDTLGVVRALSGDPDGGLELLRGAAEVARACGSDDELWRAVSNTSYVLQNVGREAQSVAVVEEALSRLDPAAPHPPAAVTAVGNVVSALILLGRWDEAEAWVEWVEARRPPPGLAAHVAVTRCEIGVLRGRVGATELAAARVVVDRSSEPDLIAALWRLESEHRAWAGDVEAARHAVAAGIAASERTEDPESMVHMLEVALRVEADAAVLPGLVDEARTRSLRERARTVGTSTEPLLPDARLAACWCEAEAARALDEPQTDHWTRAVAAARGVGRPYRLAYALLRLSEARLAGGDRRRAAESLAEATALAERLDARPLADAGRALARRAHLPQGVPAQRSGVSGGPDAGPLATAAARFGLTAREVEVLHLLVEGASNRQIARRLFISERTVGVHVSNILAKLQVTSRQRAAAIAHSWGLTAEA